VSIRIEGSVASLPRVTALPDELLSVMMNLFLNAGDAMPDGGLIRVGGAMEGEARRASRRGRGDGHPEEHLGHIFEPLFSTKREAGMGIGLAIAAELMRRLGGSIRAHNRPEGGACFELRFRPAT
jgi:signal transduction histidine kinase